MPERSYQSIARTATPFSSSVGSTRIARVEPTMSKLSDATVVAHRTRPPGSG